jgi:hypothetical protein
MVSGDLEYKLNNDSIRETLYPPLPRLPSHHSNRDILQKVMQWFSIKGGLKHPLVLDQTYPIIQYVDDTVIILQGYLDQARLLKEILDALSSTTGLSINFDKSTFVPINLDEGNLPRDPIV